MWTNNTAKLRHRICQSNTNTRRNGAVKGADALRPDDGVGRPGAGDCDNETEVLNDGVADGDEQDVADYYRCFDRYGCSPGTDPFLVEHVAKGVEEEETGDIGWLS